MATTSDSLLTTTGQTLDEFAPPDTALCVAFSGGLDSTVLLDMLARLRPGRIRAVHVHHGLQPAADDWADHCTSVAAAMQVPCQVLRVRPRLDEGGPEAAARAARYGALAAELAPDEWLVTGQHQEDQMETLLLALARGSGVHGLAAMPSKGAVLGCPILRPLLERSRAELSEYAAAQGLSWVEDPSNADHSYDRNYLRHAVVPLLQQRWPTIAATVARSARHCASAMQVVDAVAAEHLQAIRRDQCLRVTGLQTLSETLQRHVLRAFCHAENLPVPAEPQLTEALQALLTERSDAAPLAAWPGVRIRRYRDFLWCFAASSDPGAMQAPVDPLPWNGATPCALGELRGSLELRAHSGAGIAGAALASGIEIRFRGGGEKIRTAAGGARRSFKKLLQEEAVLPWMRNHIPLLYLDGQLAAAGNGWLNFDHAAVVHSQGLRPVWRPEVAWQCPFGDV